MKVPSAARRWAVCSHAAAADVMDEVGRVSQDFGLDLSLADLGVKADEEGLIEFGQFKLLLPS
jgi:hypothetical protein